MELGGNNPVIVSEDANVAKAAKLQAGADIMATARRTAPHLEGIMCMRVYMMNSSKYL
jgi:hypothetical protein